MYALLLENGYVHKLISACLLVKCYNEFYVSCVYIKNMAI